MCSELLDAAGRRALTGDSSRLPVWERPAQQGQAPSRRLAEVEEIIAVIRIAGEGLHGACIGALIVILWRAELRISEALTLTETDVEPRRGSIPVRNGKGGRRREVGMDEWAWELIEPWRRYRLTLPVGPLLCVIDGATRGRA
jgi:integrase